MLMEVELFRGRGRHAVTCSAGTEPVGVVAPRSGTDVDAQTYVCTLCVDGCTLDSGATMPVASRDGDPFGWTTALSGKPPGGRTLLCGCPRYQRSSRWTVPSSGYLLVVYPLSKAGRSLLSWSELAYSLQTLVALTNTATDVLISFFNFLST